jgi:predicted ATPase
VRDLLERETELAAIDDALRAAGDGSGCTLIVEGAAGIGKTRLLDEACSIASDAGMHVLGARGGEFERAFPFGVVRQLFEGPLQSMPGPDRDAILTGAAARAGDLLIDGNAAPAALDPGADESFAIQHGLY